MINKKDELKLIKAGPALINTGLDSMWVTGFSDGESSFSVSVSRNKFSKCGIKFIPAFAIELHAKDLNLLYNIQKFFQGVGKIRIIKSKGHAVYVVSSIHELESVIIPHFTKYPLLTIKRINFLLFKDIISLMYNKSHLKLKGGHKLL